MTAFRVWLRRSEPNRLRVDGPINARWLLDRLSQSFVFKSSASIVDDEPKGCSTFQVQCNSQISSTFVEKLLSAMPEVELLLKPA